MSYNIRLVSTFPPRMCGIGTYTRALVAALQNFPREVSSTAIAAIDKDKEEYDSWLVDIRIDQLDPASWRSATSKIWGKAADRADPTIIVLQHEYGLDGDGSGHNYVDMTKAFTENGVITLVYLHTLLKHPNEYQKKTLRELAQYSNGLIVMTQGAIDTLEKVYDIPYPKVTHIDHGIRIQHPSNSDRLKIKKQLGLEGVMLTTTIGLRSPGKGLQFGIRGYAKFIHESCTAAQRERLLYLIAGLCHPEFVKANHGKDYRAYQSIIHKAFEEANVNWIEIKEMKDLGNAVRKNDIVILDAFSDEELLTNLYAATNIMLLPYLNLEQVSSGILADTLGSGRIAIATKFQYAVELLYPEYPAQSGIIIDSHHGRGILIDPYEASIEQIALALHYLVSRKNERLILEEHARMRGHEMRWNNTAWQLLQRINYIEDNIHRVMGRGPEFDLKEDSPLERRLNEVLR